MPRVAVTEGCHAGKVVFRIRAVWNELFRNVCGALPVYELGRVNFRHEDFFAHVADDFIAHDQNRLTVSFCCVERLNGYFIAFLDGSGSIADGTVVSVGSPAGLHDILLSGFRGKSCGGTAAHDIHHNYGELSHVCEAEVFLLEGESGSGGCSQGFHPGDGAPYRGGYSGNLVLHLDKSSVQLRELFSHDFGNFRRRSDGISSEKTATGGERTVSDCLVSLPEGDIRHPSLPPSLSR